MNGDGFADVIVQWGYTITTPQTELRVFFGGSAIANTPDLSIPGPYVNSYTLQHSGRVGDLNGDGFEDIALTAFSDEGSNGGTVQLFAGGLRPTAAGVNIVTSADSYQIEPAGDVDGDGFDDALIILAANNYALYRGAAMLPRAVVMTWSDATVSSGASGLRHRPGRLRGLPRRHNRRGSNPLPGRGCGSGHSRERAVSSHRIHHRRVL